DPGLRDNGDPHTGNADSMVLILGLGGHADLSMTVEDQGENYTVVGSSRVVRVSNGVMGASGSVSGVVTTHPALPNTTALDWRNRLDDFKADPSKRLLLVTMDYSMPIYAYNISTQPNPTRDVIDVSFEYVQANRPRYVGE